VKISIIVPILNEAAAMPTLVEEVERLELAGAEVVVVDGGSVDDTCRLATEAGVRLVVAPRGRAVQMNAGAAVATGDVLLFLHADTRLPADGPELVLRALRSASWGRFNVCIAGKSRLLPVIAWMMNIRSRVTGIATGDQAIFVAR